MYLVKVTRKMAFSIRRFWSCHLCSSSNLWETIYVHKFLVSWYPRSVRPSVRQHSEAHSQDSWQGGGLTSNVKKRDTNIQQYSNYYATESRIPLWRQQIWWWCRWRRRDLLFMHFVVCQIKSCIKLQYNIENRCIEALTRAGAYERPLLQRAVSMFEVGKFTHTDKIKLIEFTGFPAIHQSRRALHGGDFWSRWRVRLWLKLDGLPYLTWCFSPGLATQYKDLREWIIFKPYSEELIPCCLAMSPWYRPRITYREQWVVLNRRAVGLRIDLLSRKPAVHLRSNSYLRRLIERISFGFHRLR